MRFLVLVLFLFSVKSYYAQMDSTGLKPPFFNQMNIFISNPISADDDSTLWINEYTGSGNYNDIERYSGKENRGGFGFGVYHNSKERRGFSTNVGFELNYTNYYGRLAPNHNHGMYRYSNMDASMTAFTVPFTVRYHIGERFSVFPEAGVFMEFNSRARGKGKAYSYSGNAPNYTVTVTDFNGTVALRKVNYGLTAGLGFLIPIGKNNILVKAEYRYGQLELTPDYYSQAGVYNRYFRFSAGYAEAMRKNNKEKKKVQIINEIRASVNYNGIDREYLPFYIDNYKEKSQLGFGVAAYHTTRLQKEETFNMLLV